MRFRADWLREVLTVPYVPILGPVHPDLADSALFEDVLTAALDGVVLPYDKDSRWTDREHDVPLIDEIVHQPRHTIIPVLSRRGGGMIKLFFYGPQPDLRELRQITRRHCRTHGAAHGRVVVFGENTPHRDGTSTRLLIKDFHASSPSTSTSVVAELRPDQRTDFQSLANGLDDHGFGFLARRLADGMVNGPILIAWDKMRMVGAIGPLDTLRDRRGVQMLLPQYFGVLPEHHGQGHGRALWRAAANWGHRHGAAYQLLQTQPGQASDHLFLSEGLRSLGFTTTVTA
jgi:GNAT superfamily N-acetyltransferase